MADVFIDTPDEHDSESSVGRIIRYLLSFIPPVHGPELRAAAVSSGRSSVITSSTNPLWDSYRKHLSLMGHGTPIWIPEPNESLNIAYRKQGTSIGDVVFFTSDGALDFLFNVCLPADHPINSGGVPEGFTPFAPPLTSSDTRRYQQYGDNSHLASKSITKSMGGMLPSGVLFTSSSSEGAILTMPEGAYSEDLTRVSGFHQYLSENLASWYRYVNQDRQWGVEMGELHLVRGVHKANAWGIATFQFAQATTTMDVNLQLKAKDIHPYGTLYSWEYSGITDSPRTGPTTQQRQSLFRNLPVEERGQSFENQCLFVRTVNAALQPLQEMRDSKADGTTNTADANAQSGVSGSSGGRNEPRQISSNVELSETRRSLPGGLDTSYKLPEVQRSPSLSVHPSRIINDFLLQEVFYFNFLTLVEHSPGIKKPNGKIAITDDQHWMSLLTQDDIMLPTGDEFLARLTKSYRITEDKGIISLKFIDSDIKTANNTPEIITMPVTSRSDSDDILFWTNVDSRESTLFNSRGVVYRFQTTVMQNGETLTTMWRALRHHKENRIATLEWAPNGGLGRVLVGKQSQQMSDLVRPDPDIDNARSFTGPDGLQYVWRPRTTNIDIVLQDPDGVVIAFFRPTRQTRYQIGDVYGELHFLKTAGSGIVTHPPMMDMVTLTAMLYRFCSTWNL